MKPKTLWKISITTLPEAADAVAELLLTCCHQPAANYLDLESGVSTITAYLPNLPDWPKARKLLNAGLARIKACDLQLGAGDVSLEKVRRENWAESWKKHFQPIEIGDTLLIKPSWSKRRVKKKQAVIVLDPGLSFGTGQHPTTSFCLQQLARHRSPGQKQSFLDIGTGSGILAIAAAKLGYAPVAAFDFDPESVAVARENIRRNRVTNKIDLRQADVTKLPRRAAKKYSLVCANLISNLLISEQSRIVATVQPDGVLVLAGILREEFPQVRTVFEKAGLRLVAERAENEWCSGAFVRPDG